MQLADFFLVYQQSD